MKMKNSKAKAMVLMQVSFPGFRIHIRSVSQDRSIDFIVPIGKGLRGFFLYFCFLHLLFLSILNSAVRAEENGGDSKENRFLSRSTLTGNWGGFREKLSDHGVDLSFAYTGEIVGNFSGGIRRDASCLGLLEMGLSVDLEKLAHWKGASIYISGVGAQGSAPSAFIGDVQGVSSLESESFWKIQEAWLQQKIWQDRLSFLAGLYEINSEFDSIEAASLFLNSSRLIGLDFAQSGKNGPSTYPAPGLGLRVRLEPKPWLYLEGGFFDGAPGDPNDVSSMAIAIHANEGFLIVGEIGFLSKVSEEQDQTGKFALGAWGYTSQFEDLIALDDFGNPLQHGRNFGIYGLGEYTVFRESGDDEQGLEVFGRWGYANPDFNPVEHFFSVGMVYTGLFPHRDQDKIGLGMTAAIHGNPFRQAQSQEGFATTRTETNFELTYRAQLTPWLFVQPDLQLVLNPGINPEYSHALAGGVRVHVEL